MNIQVQIVNAFTDGGLGGNPAGVVLDADDLNDQQKLIIASKVGLSETAFVSSSNSATFKLDFFTPTRQIAHCGHATIATFSYLRKLNRIQQGSNSKQTIEGNREIFIDGNMAYMQQLSPDYQDMGDQVGPVLKSLGVSENDLMENFRPVIVNTGNSFLVIPMKNEEAVLQINPDFDAINKISEDYDLIGYYIFSQSTRKSGRAAGARMFAPRYGINEESATGMAAGPLAYFLYDRLNIDQAEFSIEQGQLITPASPSLITAKLNLVDNKITRLMVGGEANVMQSMTISI